MSRIVTRRGALAWALAVACAVGAAAQNQQSSDQNARIREGITALHHFEYDDARAAFEAAQRIAPGSVLAVVGEALTYDQVLWRLEDVPAGRRALARLGATPIERATRAVDPRERDVLAAVESLFGDGDMAARHERWLEALETLATRYPADADIGSWYALARLSTASRGFITAAGAHDAHDRQLAGSDTQRQVAGLLLRILATDKTHPGALHYLLHTYDDPEHARLALDAARAYASIAHGASHALHMPAHIFLQLGLWHDAAASDRAAFDASTERATRQHVSPALRNFHALSWLQYELLQLGRYEEARRLLDELQPAVAQGRPPTQKGPVDAHQPLQSNLSSMRARYVVETRRWNLLAAEQQFGNVDELLAIGLSAARRGNRELAERVRQALTDRSTSAAEGDLRPGIVIMAREVAATIAFADGRRDEAIAILVEAAQAERALPPPFGPPQPVKPATELLGEFLMESGRPAEAVDRFQEVLRRHPNRSLALVGLARAETAAGRDASRDHYRELLANFDGADTGMPEIAEAHRAIDAPRTTPQRVERSNYGLVAPVAIGGAALTLLALLIVSRTQRRQRAKKPLRKSPPRPS